MNTLEILHEKKQDRIDVLSPAVGMVGHLPTNGCLINAKSSLGTLEILGTVHSLHMPASLQGKVVNADEEFLFKPVFYGQRLFSMLPFEAHGFEDPGERKNERAAGSYEICAPTQGIFYHRPSPDSPPYVKVGDTVKLGGVLGLVEVMKCFNQILYSGAGLPETAKVVEVCIKDGAEVQYRQPLFYFE